MTAVCDQCESTDVVAAAGEWVCRRCQARWPVTLGDLVEPPEVREICLRVRLRFPTTVLSGVRHPNLDVLQQGIAALSSRRAENRLGRIESAIATIEEVERITERNLDELWDGRRDDRRPRPFRGRPCSAEAAIAALDRVLGRVREFDRMWDHVGRSADTLWRDTWDHSGHEVADDLPILAEEREFLQISRTLIAERLSEDR